MIVPSQRGQKRGRGAPEDDEAVGAARGSPRRAAAIYAIMEEAFMEEVGENDDKEEVEAAKQLIDFMGVHQNDDDAKARSSKAYEEPVDAMPRPGVGVGSRSAATTGSAALDEDDVRALCQQNLPFLLPPSPSSIHYDVEFAAAAADPSHGSAPPEDEDLPVVVPDHAPNPSSGFDFDLNQEPSSSSVSEDAGVLVVPDDAVDGSAATADDGSVELVDDATIRPPSNGFDLDLNQPCPSEFPDGAPEPSDVPDPAPASAEDNLAGPDAGERPEFPDGGGALSRARRLWDWAFEWTNGLALGRPGWKRSRR